MNHDQIVSLDSRLAYILDRYGRAGSWLNQAIRDNFALCQRIEEKLFTKMDFPPESLTDQIVDVVGEKTLYELDFERLFHMDAKPESRCGEKG